MKNVGRNLTHFCLGPKTEISCWDPRFSVRSKILVFHSTVLWEVLILVSKKNWSWKLYARIWSFLEITSLKEFKIDVTSSFLIALRPNLYHIIKLYCYEMIFQSIHYYQSKRILLSFYYKFRFTWKVWLRLFSHHFFAFHQFWVSPTVLTYIFRRSCCWLRNRMPYWAPLCQQVIQLKK